LDYKDSLPWGYCWNKMLAANGAQAPGNNNDYISWLSLAGKYANRRGDGILNYSQKPSTDTDYTVLAQCPEAEAQIFHWCSYVGTISVLADPYNDVRYAGSSALRRAVPSKFSRLWPDTCLLFDSSIIIGYLNAYPNDPGWLLNYDVDFSDVFGAQRFWAG